jgi:hypothetical protein
MFDEAHSQILRDCARGTLFRRCDAYLMTCRNNELPKVVYPAVRTSICCVFFALSSLNAAEKLDFDNYKFRIDTDWYYVTPSGDLHGTNEADTIDLQKDLGFSNYSIFAGKVDWKFTRKNHLYVAVSPVNFSR